MGFGSSTGLVASTGGDCVDSMPSRHPDEVCREGRELHGKQSGGPSTALRVSAAPHSI